jgi:hypothetical protein
MKKERKSYLVSGLPGGVCAGASPRWSSASATGSLSLRRRRGALHQGLCQCVRRHARVEGVRAGWDPRPTMYRGGTQIPVPIEVGRIGDEPPAMEHGHKSAHTLAAPDADNHRAALHLWARTDGADGAWHVVSGGGQPQESRGDDGGEQRERQQRTAGVVEAGTALHVAVGRGPRAVEPAHGSRHPLQAQAPQLRHGALPALHTHALPTLNTGIPPHTRLSARTRRGMGRAGMSLSRGQRATTVASSSHRVLVTATAPRTVLSASLSTTFRRKERLHFFSSELGLLTMDGQKSAADSCAAQC